MFNLNSFDLDIDDDFSSNIFSKSVNFGLKREPEGINLNVNREREKALGKKHVSLESTSNHKITELSTKQIHHQTDSGPPRSSTNNFLDFPFAKNSGDNFLKRSFAQDEKPQKKRLSSDGLLQRKFPGPAGLLPDKPLEEISDLALETDKINDENEDEGSKEKEIVFSQNSGSMFLESSYQKLVSDFNLSESSNSLNRYTIEWVKKIALSKGFQKRKIPFLGLVVHSVNQGISDSILVLKDPTGEIHGSLHKEVWTDLGGKLKAGIALALRQVGVLITGVIRRQIYLNITMNNILSLYSPTENGNRVEITTVNKVSKQELMKSFEDWLAQPSKNVVPSPSLDSPLFTTVNDLSVTGNSKEEIKNLRNKLENLIDKSKEVKRNTGERHTEEVLANLGLVLSDNDFKEEMAVPQTDPNRSQVDLFENEKMSGSRTSTQMLSQAESLIFEEVLSGINLDEFET